jgi:prepilin signal peptidase PulO-like enzyme (type II secretory pathway)
MNLLMAVITGISCGALINYLADVLPESRRLTHPACPAYERPYTLKEYLLFQKCPNCSHKRVARPLIVLVAAILCAVGLQLFPFAGLNFWATLPLLIFLGVVTVIDMEHRLVLTETSLFGLILCLVYGVVLRGWGNTLLGGLGGLLIMLAFFLMGILFSKVIGKLRGRNIKQVAFGFGDVAAGTFLGLLTGWPGILAGITLGILAFTVFTIPLLLILIIAKKYSAFTSALPLVPFLVLGAIVIFYL